jgi:hypothetical protein
VCVELTEGSGAKRSAKQAGRATELSTYKAHTSSLTAHNAHPAAQHELREDDDVGYGIRILIRDTSIGPIRYSLAHRIVRAYIRCMSEVNWQGQVNCGAVQSGSRVGTYSHDWFNECERGLTFQLIRGVIRGVTGGGVD